MTNDQCQYDNVFEWDGWGGAFKLGSGKCWLRIFDLTRGAASDVSLLQPIITMAMDHPESPMSVRSCVGHIATRVVADFHITPSRMLFVEYYPAVDYGVDEERHIPQRFERVDFQWHGRKALFPKWRAVADPLIETLHPLVAGWKRSGNGPPHIPA